MGIYALSSRIHFRLLFICLAAACFVCEVKAADDLTRQSALESENAAVQLSKEWNGDSIRRSTLLFLKASDDWAKLGERKRATFCLRESAKLSLLISEYDQAFGALNKALRIADKIKNNNDNIIILSLLSRASKQKGDVKKSENYYQQALIFSKSSSSPDARANALFSAAYYNFSYGNIKETIKLYEEALSFAEKAEDKDLIAQTLLPNPAQPRVFLCPAGQPGLRFAKGERSSTEMGRNRRYQRTGAR
jgi:tetratricopeptide (TPR) repeat protein